MAILITRIGSWTLADDGWSAHFGLADYRGQFEGQPQLTPRAGSSPSLSQGMLTQRTMPVTFVYPHTGALDMAAALQVLAGRLATDDPTPRRIVGTEFDGTEVQITAAVGLTSGWTEDNSMNLVLGTLVSGDVRWEATIPTVVSGVLNDFGQVPSLPVPNAGYATVEPTITITAGGTTHWELNSAVGWQYRRQATFTNSEQDAWVWPLRLDLGATDSWVSGAKALSSGWDFRVLLDGVELPRTLIGFNWPRSFCWIVPPPIASGATVTFDVIYGCNTAAAADTLTGKLHPSFIYEFDLGTVSSVDGTSPKAVLHDATKAWSTTRLSWVGAFLWFVSGSNAGQLHEVTAWTANTLTVGNNFVSNFAIGDKYLVVHSSNTRKWFNVGEWFDDSSATPVRGLWYLDKRLRQPSDIDFDVPCSWAPWPLYDNTDRFAQKSVSVIGGKYFAELDAYRTWQGGSPLTTEDGIGDGVMLHATIPILGVQTNYTLKNNLNSMCQAVVAARASGAEDWEIVASHNDAGDSTVSAYVTLPTPDKYYFLYRGLIPSDAEGIIRTDRARDSGSTSSDGATRTVVTNATTPLGGWYLRKDADSSSAHVQDSTPADIIVTNSIPVELDGRQSGSWRGVIYNDGTNEYKGWLPVAFLSGTSTGGDTLVDGSKNWVSSELVGATVKITGSNNKALVGKTHTVTGNTATTITVGTAFGATVVQGTTYEVRQPKTTVAMQDASYCWVDFDTSNATLSSLGSEQGVYQVAAQFSVGDGGDEFFERRVSVRIGLDGVRVFLLATESLIIDCQNRRASIVTTATGDVVRWLTDPAVLVQQLSWNAVNKEIDTKRAARWLPLTMGTLIDGTDPTMVIVSNKDAGWTVAGGALSQDSAAGSWWSGTDHAYLLDVTANTGGAFSSCDIVLNHLIGFNPGDRVGYMLPVRTNNLNLQPRLGIDWYTAGGSFISATLADLPALAANIWSPATFEAIAPENGVSFRVLDSDFKAPANATQAKFFVRVFDLVGGTTGRIRVGSPEQPGEGFCWGAPKLWYNEFGGQDLNVSVSFREGFLG